MFPSVPKGIKTGKYTLFIPSPSNKVIKSKSYPEWFINLMASLKVTKNYHMVCTDDFKEAKNDGSFN